MAHPRPEKWMDYVYGELDGEARAGLDEHLRGCAECRATVDGWRGAMADLDAWELPEARPERPRQRRLLPLAAAALLMVAVGYLVGRTATAPQVDAEQIKAELAAQLAPQIRRQVEEEVASRLAADMAEARKDVEADVYMRLRREIDAAATETLLASSALAGSMVNDAVASFDATHRSDLLALASMTEQEFLRTRRDIAVALGYGPATMPVKTDSLIVPEQNGGS